MSTDTLRHQLLYEVHDPARYLSPDVVADFTSAHFDDLPDDEVRITGVRGTPATDTLQAAARVPRRLGGRGARRVLVARRVREGEGDRRDPREAGRDGRRSRSTSGTSSTGVSTRSAGRPCRRADERRVRAARVRAARRVALRRPAHARAGRPRARAAHAVGAAGRADRRGRRRPAGATELLAIWPTLDRQAARRRPACASRSRRCS